MDIVSATAERGTSSKVGSIIVAGLVIGIVGGLDQATFAVLTQHATPVSFFQYIASSVLGLAAFSGGYTTALLGLLIHFVISLVVAGVFILAASTITLLRRTVFLSALVYGAAVNFISGLLLPLTAAPKLPFSTLLLVHGLVAGALSIGLPVAITVWQSGRVNKAIATA